MFHIAVFLCLSIFLSFIAVIIGIMDKQVPGMTLQEDFISHAVHAKKQSLARNPWSMLFRTYALISVLCAMAGAAIGYFLADSVLLAILLVPAGLYVPEIIEAVRTDAERGKFEERYARALRQISSSLKSGLSNHQAVTELGENSFIHDSIRNEFRQLDTDLKIGLSVQEGFERFARRVNHPDAQDVAIAIAMQNDVGGNNVLVVETIARDINSRIMSRRETKSLFSGSASTVTMMDIVPTGIIAFISFASPEYIAPFFQSTVLTIAFWGLIGFALIGSFVIRRIIRKMKEDCGI